EIGPLTLDELKGTLPSLPNAKEILVWRDGFSNWKRADEVPELRARTVTLPPLPSILAEPAKIARRTSQGWPRRSSPSSSSRWKPYKNAAHEPPRASAERSRSTAALPLEGIAGWLILPVLGTILAPFYMAYGAVQLAASLSSAAGGSLLRSLDLLSQS